MNLLAHAYLSFLDQDILVGNMISDHVKGKKQFEYEPRVQLGIQLHRAIDEYTDQHPATQAIKAYFRPHYRLYASPLTDIVYDYFLANDTREFAGEQDLYDFTQVTYAQLGRHNGAFPLTFKALLPSMEQQNWLYNYRLAAGIEKSFRGLAYRAKYLSETQTAYSVFQKYLPDMAIHYRAFFPMLKNFTAVRLQELLAGDNLSLQKNT